MKKYVDYNKELNWSIYLELCNDKKLSINTLNLDNFDHELSLIDDEITTMSIVSLGNSKLCVDSPKFKLCLRYLEQILAKVKLVNNKSAIVFEIELQRDGGTLNSYLNHILPRFPQIHRLDVNMFMHPDAMHQELVMLNCDQFSEITVWIDDAVFDIITHVDYHQLNLLYTTSQNFIFNLPRLERFYINVNEETLHESSKQMYDKYGDDGMLFSEDKILDNYTILAYHENEIDRPGHYLLKGVIPRNRSVVASRNRYLRKVICKCSLTLILIRKHYPDAMLHVDKHVILMISKLVFQQRHEVKHLSEIYTKLKL